MQLQKGPITINLPPKPTGLKASLKQAEPTVEYKLENTEVLIKEPLITKLNRLMNQAQNSLGSVIERLQNK